MPISSSRRAGRRRTRSTALDAGADDYLTKPFGAGELLARIRVALRHAARARRRDTPDPVLTIGELTIDLAKRVVTKRGGGGPPHAERVQAARRAREARGQGVTHRQLLKEVWGPGHAEQTHYLRVYMAQLRHKLEDDPARPRYLLTEPGVGYRLAID